MLPLVVPGAREKIAKHRAEGHVLAILSTSPTYVTEPLAEVLGIEEVISTRFEVESGQFTGASRRPRVRRLAARSTGPRTWSRAANFDLSQSWFYTDSYTDLPMLERVGQSGRREPRPAPQAHRQAARLARTGLGCGPTALIVSPTPEASV